MPTQPTMGMNPMLALLPPDQQQNLMQLQQQQAIGQALLQQGLQPIDTSNRQVGGMGYRISPLEGLAKMANMYVGNKIARDSMGQQAQIMGQMYGNAFGGQPQAPQAAPVDAGGMTGGQSGEGVVSAPIATPGAADLGAAMGGATQVGPQTQMANGVLTMPGKTPQQSMILYGMLGPEAYAKMLEAQTAPTAATLAARQGGFDPAAANQLQFRKDTYVAPTTGTGIMRNPFTQQPVAFNPDVPNGATPLFDASGNVAAVKPIAGAQGVMQGNAAATAAGGAQFKPIQVYNPVTHQMEYSNEATVTNPPQRAGAAPTISGIFAQQESSDGKTAPDNPMQIQQGTFKQYAQPGESWSNPADRTAVANRVLSTYQQKYGGDLGRIATAYFSGEGNVAPPGSPTPYLRNVSDANGKSVASYVGDIQARAGSSSGSAPAAAPPLGAATAAEKGAGNLQDELSKKWTDLNAQNQQAQGVISNLQNIKTLAAKAAVGPQSDRLNYVNGLLSLAGSEKATDAVTANDLLNKYSNQITSRLSAGGMGTDAARAILQSAYPNAHMTAAAINEAADNLQGASQMIQAKTRLLAPLRNAGDAAGYTNAELKFDQNADPRIFQYANIKDPAARASFARNLMQQDPTIVNKIQTLQQLGALK